MSADIIEFPQPRTKTELWVEYVSIMNPEGVCRETDMLMFKIAEKDWTVEELQSRIAEERQLLCDQARATLARFGQT